ncbi:MAG TPA: hypothetical protein EYQ31_09300 [Candidatus Handelsmanbacteria bacterium]|nr:hypothetical protein [Candidatus Handelsmanbacteria bacterium]
MSENLLGALWGLGGAHPGDAPPRLSFRRDEFVGVSAWRKHAPGRRPCFLNPPARGLLPAMLALHDHGGRKYFVPPGDRVPARPPPSQIAEHEREHYSDRGWANEIARRGYAVLVPDEFLFCRRIRYADVPEHLRANLRERSPESSKEVR